MSHLIHEKSPYLLQHVENPVDWYPWSEAAFERARDEHKPVFLSIGYSTCHWCHVMAHESFADPEVAAILNRGFIAVKVDREERPDIDQVYMEVCQRLTGSGGWPLTIIMTPAGEPFYAATYLPKNGRHGRPGMMDLLPWIAQKWQAEPELLVNAAREVVREIETHQHRSSPGSLAPAHQDQAEHQLKKSFAPRYGGFGRAPKFPRPHDLQFLLDRHRLTGDRACLEMVEKTLLNMRCGGIYDQLGYGFHRYATDEQWLVPHFEKMLYDQAGLIMAYLEAWQVTGKATYAVTVDEIITYLTRDMAAPDGAFYSAEDADSEGEEGTFYLWSEQEIASLLGERAAPFCSSYRVNAAGNYQEEVSGRATGRNILHLAPDADALDAARAQLRDERGILFHARSTRERPHRDDKIITAWNGQLVSALAMAGSGLENGAYIEQAVRAADFVLEVLSRDGQLLRRYRDGASGINAFAEDYAFLCRGLLDLYVADYEIRWLSHAVRLAGILIAKYQDPDSGRLYDTACDGESLLVRPASTFDGAMPAAGSIALDVLGRLSLLTGDKAWRTAAERLMQSLHPDVSRYPAGFTQCLRAANWLLRPTREVVIVGKASDPACAEMLAVARGQNAVQTVVLFKSAENGDELARLAPFTAAMQTRDGLATAYLCENSACQPPVTDLALLRRQLAATP